MMTDERLSAPLEGAPPSRQARGRLNFRLRALMALPVLVAALVTAYTAIDRWTAVPWSGPDPGTPVIYKVLDAATGQPIVGARVKIVDGGLVFDMKTSAPGYIRRFGGEIQGTGHRSLVRDTRRVDLGDTSLLVTAEGYEDYSAEASEAPLVARPAPDGKSVEYVIELRRTRD
jgi:hypothetical protein